MQTNHSSDTMTVKITPNDKGNPPGKLAEAELHFGGDSPLAGPKLIGFSIWERRGGTGRNVTFPARSYSINGASELRAPAAGGRHHGADRRARTHPGGVRGVRRGGRARHGLNRCRPATERIGAPSLLSVLEPTQENAATGAAGFWVNCLFVFSLTIRARLPISC